MSTLDNEFWDQRYLENTAVWDIGDVSRPIKEYIDQLENKNISILIPGCGNAHEAAYLYQQGFRDITLIDISPVLVKNLKEVFKGKEGIKIIEGDFFKHKGSYDLILEQTFFCALDPKLRESYTNQMHELLKPGGKLVGLLFNCEFEKEGPPFGGSKSEYENYFKDKLELKVFEPCYNSIEKRQGNELFFVAIKQK